jgi:proline iminopeptidase
MLDAGDRHHVYWECCGNPAGKPALFLHGGPGSGCSAGQRRFFDPSLYNMVLFDQRGSGRSRPLASDLDADLSTNTTQHLIADIEALRELRGIDRWTILGVSWGSTLALAYAQTYPKRVNAMVLALVTTTSHREVRWITEDMGRVFPQQWERFIDAIPQRLRHLRPVESYARMVADADPITRDNAAREWCAWEDAHVSLAPGHVPSPRYQDPEFRLRFARLVTHYWRHAAFLEEDQLIQGAAKLNGVPGVLIHGRFDISGPLFTAWRLSQRWTSSRLQLLDDAGHGGGNSFLPAVVDALNEFAL